MCDVTVDVAILFGAGALGAWKMHCEVGDHLNLQTSVRTEA
jgi:hypothetical protein